MYSYVSFMNFDYKKVR